ncbi:MAG TPA: HAMP domain-containing sensor histidine kinase [Thermosynechococcaceae cyanobacterium]
MEFLWFLLGLAIGLALLGCQLIQLQFALRRLLKDLKLDEIGWSLLPTARLVRAITIQHRARRSLEQDLEDWKHVIQQAPIGFLQVDEENQLLWSNPQARHLLDIQQVHPKPRLLLELVRSYDLDQLIEQTRLAEHPQQQEWVFHPISTDQSQLSQQQPRPLRAYGLPLGQGSVGVFLESRQETALLVQQRDRWTSDVAHELKTPLTSIRLVAETLQPRLDPSLRHWVDRLLNETLRLSNLVQDLLDLSHLKAQPTSQLHLKTVDLAKLVQSAWMSLEPLARRKSLQLDYVGPTSLLIQADEPRLHRVLLNLLDNGIQYSPARQKIQVQIRLASEGAVAPQVHLDVIDAGPGFSEATLPYVFDRFYRGDPSRARNFRAVDLDTGTEEFGRQALMAEVVMPSQGSGLGLAIVRQIVEAHNGSVQARNHPETQGAWLQVVLPLAAASPTES